MYGRSIAFNYLTFMNLQTGNKCVEFFFFLIHGKFESDSNPGVWGPKAFGSGSSSVPMHGSRSRTDYNHVLV